jgi:hypothetical protein
MFELETSLKGILCVTRVLVLSFVHLAVRALARDTDYLKLVHAAFAPVDLCLFDLTKPGSTDPGEERDIKK